MKSLHIVYAIPEFVTEKGSGGLGTYYDNVSRLLADCGHKVTVFVYSDRDETIDYYPGVTLKRCFVDINSVNSRIPGSYIRLWTREINRRVREYKDAGGQIDLVQYANFNGFGFERLDDVPTVVRFSSFQPYMRAASRYDFDPNGGYWCESAADYLEMMSVIEADAVYSPSKMIAEVFEKAIGKPVRVIESPFYPNPIEEPDDCDDICQGRYIMTFSSMKLLKGIRLIGECIKTILEQNPDVSWVFAGDEVPWTDDKGNTVVPSEFIREKAGKYADRVIVLGKVGHERLLPVIKKAAVCVMPSRMDNLPNTCIEAMALGRVVVGTKGASFEQLIDDGESGFLIERENGKELIQTVGKALALGDSARERMGKRAQARIEKMKPDLIASELIDLYQKTIDDFRGTPQYHSDSFYEELKENYNRVIREKGEEGFEGYLL